MEDYKYFAVFNQTHYLCYFKLTRKEEIRYDKKCLDQNITFHGYWHKDDPNKDPKECEFDDNSKILSHPLFSNSWCSSCIKVNPPPRHRPFLKHEYCKHWKYLTGILTLNDSEDIQTAYLKFGLELSAKYNPLSALCSENILPGGTYHYWRIAEAIEKAFEKKCFVRISEDPNRPGVWYLKDISFAFNSTPTRKDNLVNHPHADNLYAKHKDTLVTFLNHVPLIVPISAPKPTFHFENLSSKSTQSATNGNSPWFSFFTKDFGIVILIYFVFIFVLISWRGCTSLLNNRNLPDFYTTQ